MDPDNNSFADQVRKVFKLSFYGLIMASKISRIFTNALLAVGCIYLFGFDILSFVTGAVLGVGWIFLTQYFSNLPFINQKSPYQLKISLAGVASFILLVAVAALLRAFVTPNPITIQSIAGLWVGIIPAYWILQPKKKT